MPQYTPGGASISMKAMRHAKTALGQRLIPTPSILLGSTCALFCACGTEPPSLADAATDVSWREQADAHRRSSDSAPVFEDAAPIGPDTATADADRHRAEDAEISGIDAAQPEIDASQAQVDGGDAHRADSGVIPRPVPIKVYKAPTTANSLPLYGDFSVTVGGQESPVYRVLLNAEHVFKPPPYVFRTQPAGMTYFDVGGPATVVVNVKNRAVSTARVVPSSFNITPRVAGDQVTVDIPGPGKYELQINGETSPLYLFANPIEVDPPRPGDPGVLYYGPGVHSVGIVNVGGPTRKTVYIAGGALVKGRLVSRDNSDVTIRGRGILDTSDFAVRTGSPVTLSNGHNIKLEGFIIHNSAGWTVKLFHLSQVLVDNIKIIGNHRQNADGIDVVNSQHVEVRNIFARVNDDVLVIKGFADGDDCCAYPSTGKYPPERNSVNDVWFHDCIVTTELANGTLEIGYELWGKEVKNVRFENIIVPHSYAKSIIGIHLIYTDMRVHDIRYDNILVEDYHGGDRGRSWFNIEVRRGGTLADVAISNVRFVGGMPAPSVIEGSAATINNIRLSRITHDGRPLATLEALGFNAGAPAAPNVRAIP